MRLRQNSTPSMFGVLRVKQEVSRQISGLVSHVSATVGAIIAPGQLAGIKTSFARSDTASESLRPFHSSRILFPSEGSALDCGRSLAEALL